MAFTLNNAPISVLDATFPEYGNWLAVITLTTDPTFAIGSVATLTLEDLTLTGCVISGGRHLSRGTYRVVGGAGAWRLPLDPGGLRSDGGIKLSTAANALLTAANLAASKEGLAGRESIEVLADRSLGPAFVRPRALGTATLDAFGPWFVRPNGVTAIGVRPVLGASSARIIPEDFDPGHQKLPLALPQGDIAALVNSIGGTLSGAPLESPVLFRSLYIQLAKGKVRYYANP